MKVTSKDKEQYLKLARTLALFCYTQNTDIALWKKEHHDAFFKTANKNLQLNDFEEWQRNAKIYYEALATYAEQASAIYTLLAEYKTEQVLSALGLEMPSDAECNYSVIGELKYDYSLFPRNENFPTSFPCVTYISSSPSYQLSVIHIYKDDFKKSPSIKNYEWLEEKVVEYWSKK